MRIVHVCLRGPYTDNWGYQENIMPRVHKRIGHDVTVIAPTFGHAPSGEIVDFGEGDYVLSDGVRVVRKAISEKYGKGKLKKFLLPYNIYPLLKQLEPDLIMLHGLSIYDGNNGVIKFLKENKSCCLVGDTHQFYGNSGKPTTLKSRLVRWYHKISFRKIYPYYDKIFAITPACVDFAVENFGLNREEIDLLPLGFDPELSLIDKKEQIRAAFREEHNIDKDDILIVHGGKIIKRRKTPETMEGIARINNSKVKLVMFGAIDIEMESTVRPLLEKYKDKVIYKGALKQEEYYKVFLASDIAVFPGGQSALWQEAIGTGLPLAVSYDHGLEYLNRGGNVVFIKDATADGIFNTVRLMLENNKYLDMKQVAESQARDFFSYERIARMVTDVGKDEKGIDKAII